MYTKNQVGSYVLWIELQRFYARPWEAETGDSIVVIRDGLVLDASEAALARGVRRGASKREAKAILQGGVFKSWHQEDYVERSRAWLDLCVAFTDVIEPADQHAAWLDLSAHPNPMDVADTLIQTLARGCGLKVRYGVAASKWLSKLAADYDDCGEALHDPIAFLAPLPVAELLPVSIEHRERLRFLGYPKIENVVQLPLNVLQAQFDAAAYTIYGAARGAVAQEVKAHYPPGTIAERVVFEGPVESLETLDDACRLLARQVGDRLEREGMESGKVRLIVELEEGRKRSVARTFSKPLRCARSGLASIRLLMDKLKDAPITAIRVCVLDLRKVQQFQPALLERTVQERNLRIDSALRQVRTVYGDRSVQRGNELQLPRRVRVLREWKHVTGWR